MPRGPVESDVLHAAAAAAGTRGMGDMAKSFISRWVRVEAAATWTGVCSRRSIESSRVELSLGELRRNKARQDSRSGAGPGREQGRPMRRSIGIGIGWAGRHDKRSRGGCAAVSDLRIERLREESLGQTGNEVKVVESHVTDDTMYLGTFGVYLPYLTSPHLTGTFPPLPLTSSPHLFFHMSSPLLPNLYHHAPYLSCLPHLMPRLSQSKQPLDLEPLDQSLAVCPPTPLPSPRNPRIRPPFSSFFSTTIG